MGNETANKEGMDSERGKGNLFTHGYHKGGRHMRYQGAFLPFLKSSLLLAVLWQTVSWLPQECQAHTISYQEWRQTRIDDFTTRHRVGEIYDGFEITGYAIVLDGVWSGSYGERDPNDIYYGPVYSATMAFDGTSYNVTVGWDAIEPSPSSSVPEPTSAMLISCGLAGLVFMRKLLTEYTP